MRPRHRVHRGLAGDRARHHRVGCLARVRGDPHRVVQERRLARDLSELRRELAVGEVQRAVVDQPERRGVPEGRGAAVAERHLVSLRGGEQFAQPGANFPNQPFDRRLAVGGAQQRAAFAREARQRLGSHLRGSAAKAPVGGDQLGGDDEWCGLGCVSHSRSLLSW